MSQFDNADEIVKIYQCLYIVNDMEHPSEEEVEEKVTHFAREENKSK